MKDVVGFEGLYAITENGEVWSYRTNRFIKSFVRSNGYLQTLLVDKNGNKRTLKNHRMVAEAYIPNPDNLPDVNHIDENKLNNNVNNLEWMTHYDNMNYGNRNLKTSKALRKKVRCVELDKIFNSITEAAYFINRSGSGISEVLNGKQKMAGGYHWEYVQNIEKKA